MFSIFKQVKPAITVKTWGTPPNLFFTAYVKGTGVMWMKCIIYPDYIHIGDILPLPEDSKQRFNKGYGSALIQTLLKYAEEKGFPRIVGNLSAEDLDHRDRLHHFYTKFGFTITEFASPVGVFYGKIYKDIDV